uniref:Uncharacterized protein n=1 Tax=Anopheles dirus TaxID=7168 RepID=A0A182NCN0_9DIPT
MYSLLESRAMQRGTGWLVAVVVVLAAIVSPPVTGAKHVDIFQQFQDGSYKEHQRAERDEPEQEDDQDTLRTEQPTSCVEDVLPTDPLELHEKLENETAVPEAPVQDVPPPNLSELFTKLTQGIFHTSLFQIGQKVRDLLGTVRQRLQAYTNATVVRFEHQRHRAMSAVQRKVDEVNGRIRAYFQNEFVEYRDVCLPDANRCMQLLHTQIDQYEHRLRANVDECHDKLAQHLAKQRREVDEAQQLMNGPYRRMDSCLNRDAGFGRSFLACSGSAVSNLAKLTTESVDAFANRMRDLSDAFARRVDKFEKCVVKRRQLLRQNEREVSTRVKGCFAKQQSDPENFF